MITSAVKLVESAELARVKASSETPSAENGGWSGEPRAWADSTSLTQQISKVSQVGPFASLKQFIADTLAGDYDQEAIGSLIDRRIASNKVMMFSFSTCPFCLRAKDILRDDYGVEVEVYECDLEPEGNAVRAELGRRTGRTSMPSTWLGPDVLVGGCNDGGLGGVATLDGDGRLRELLSERGAFAGSEWWAGLLSFGQPDKQQVAQSKRTLRTLCAAAPKNGVGTEEAQQAEIDEAAVALQPLCQPSPARSTISGVWDLLYCTAPGGSSGKVGPFVGDVTQTFVDDTKFINAVELGVLKVALEAEREIKDDQKIRVTFKQMAFSLFGFEFLRMPAKGNGVWEQLYVDGDLRVMRTPSLFVLSKRS